MTLWPTQHKKESIFFRYQCLCVSCVIFLYINCDQLHLKSFLFRFVTQIFSRLVIFLKLYVKFMLLLQPLFNIFLNYPVEPFVEPLPSRKLTFLWGFLRFCFFYSKAFSCLDDKRHYNAFLLLLWNVSWQCEDTFIVSTNLITDNH